MAAIEDIGVDLGSSNVLIYARDKGIVLNEPAVLAVDHDTQSVIAIGMEAYKMMGREPSNIEVVRPLRSGAIRDNNMLGLMLNHFVVMVIGKRVFSRPRAVLSISSMTNELERRQLLMGMLEAGARRTQILARPLAAAVGSGLKIMPPIGHMIIDIGGANSHVAAIASGQMMAESTDICGGDAFTEAIIRYVRKEFNLMIGDRTAEEIKMQVGTAYITNENKDNSMEVRGRDLLSGLPKTIEITSEQIWTALQEPVDSVIDAVRKVLEITPPELAADIVNNGIVMTGGGSLLDGLDIILSKQTNLPVHIAEDPICCVARGTGKALHEMSALQKNRIAGTKRVL